MGGFVYRMAVIHKQSFNNILIQIQICIKAEILYFTHILFFLFVYRCKMTKTVIVQIYINLTVYWM